MVEGREIKSESENNIKEMSAREIEYSLEPKDLTPGLVINKIGRVWPLENVLLNVASCFIRGINTISLANHEVIIPEPVNLPSKEDESNEERYRRICRNTDALGYVQKLKRNPSRVRPEDLYKYYRVRGNISKQFEDSKFLIKQDKWMKEMEFLEGEVLDSVSMTVVDPVKIELEKGLNKLVSNNVHLLENEGVKLDKVISFMLRSKFKTIEGRVADLENLITIYSFGIFNKENPENVYDIGLGLKAKWNQPGSFLSEKNLL